MKKEIKDFIEFIVVISLIFVSMWAVADKIILPYYKVWEYKTTMLMISKIDDSCDDSPAVSKESEQSLAAEKEINIVSEQYDFKSMFSEGR